MQLLYTEFMVAGAGIAGRCAAISAARHGLKVVLVNDRSVLGGNASSEIAVGISGANTGTFNPAIYGKETGLVEEIRLRLKYATEFGGCEKFAAYDAVFLDMIYGEDNITLLLNTVVHGCELDNGKITAAFARHSVSGEEFRICAPLYADATGNGALAFEAGAAYRMGREAKSEFGEHWGQETPDSKTMGNTILFETEDVGHEVHYKAPAFAYDVTKMPFFKDMGKPENFRHFSTRGADWTYEFGGQLDILKDHDDIEKELRKLIYGIWDYVKNSGEFPDAKNRVLKRVYAKAGSRESRRFIGDYILTENDIEQKIDFSDSVAIGGWPMDVHAPMGIYDPAPASNFIPVTGIYNIPFRCLYTRDVTNLMLAGRDISVTHIALGSTRVMATCGAEGQAIGTAAYLAKKYSVLPRGIYQNHIQELQELLLADDQSIVHRREPVLDAQASATSVMVYENTREDGWMPLERDYALAFMAEGNPVHSIQLKLRASADTSLKYKLYTGIHPETYLPEKLEKHMQRPIQANFAGWITLPLELPVGLDGKLYLVLEQNDALEAAFCTDRTMGAVTLRMHTRSSHDGQNHDSTPLNEAATGYYSCDHNYENQRNLLFRYIDPVQDPFAAEKVLNGYPRPYIAPNLWLAADSAPQTLTVRLNQPKDLRELSLLLDCRLDLDHQPHMPDTLARNLAVTIHHRDGVCKLSVEENCRRLLRWALKLEEVTTVEVTVHSTYGGAPGIYALRLK